MLEELGNRHTNRLHTLTFERLSIGGVREQTNKQTDSLTDWCFDREIISYLHLNGLKDILKCRRPRQFTYIFKQTKRFSAHYVETLNY